MVSRKDCLHNAPSILETQLDSRMTDMHQRMVFQHLIPQIGKREFPQNATSIQVQITEVHQNFVSAKIRCDFIVHRSFTSTYNTTAMQLCCIGHVEAPLFQLWPMCHLVDVGGAQAIRRVRMQNFGERCAMF